MIFFLGHTADIQRAFNVGTAQAISRAVSIDFATHITD